MSSLSNDDMFSYVAISSNDYYILLDIDPDITYSVMCGNLDNNKIILYFENLEEKEKLINFINDMC